MTNYEIFKKELPHLIKKHKGMFVAIKNGIIYKPQKTHSDAFKSAYTTPEDKFEIYKC